MTRPERIQRQRTKGWRMPAGAVYVGRPSRWGNPVPVDGEWMTWTALALGRRADRRGRAETAVAIFRAWITGENRVASVRMTDAGTSEVEFTSGRRATVADLVGGFAAAIAESLGGPRLPVPPDLAPLRGRDLACWCPLDQPCHADVLLDLANR